MAPYQLLGDLGQADAFDTRVSPGEIFVDEVLPQADRVEDLGATVRLISGDAHLGHHL